MTAVADPTHLNGTTPLDPAPRTIVELLMEAKRRIGAVDKKGRNRDQDYNFRGIDDVVNAASPIFAELGILGPLPMLDTASYRDVRTSRDKPAREVTLVVTYRFQGPVDFLDIKVPGESMDSGDKGTPKAMSVALRIALLQALLIPTKELAPDPDSQSYERGGDTRDQGGVRDSQRLPRKELLIAVTTASSQLRDALGVGEYEWLEQLTGICRKEYGVNIVSKQATDGGPVEEIDLDKLREAQLHLLWARFRKKLAQLQGV